jgi:hypothetical protein
VSWIGAKSIKEHAWNFGRTVPFARYQATHGSHRGKRGNEENDDCNLKESQRPACEDLQGSSHCYLRQGSELGGYKKIDNVNTARFWHKRRSIAIRLAVLDS